MSGRNHAVIGMAEDYVKEESPEGKEGQVWCVYDKDSFPAEHFNGVGERANSLNKIKPELQYHAAWSNECIEFWFLLHLRIIQLITTGPEVYFILE